MDRLPDLVRDSRLETPIFDSRITVHDYEESGDTPQDRLVRRREEWEREARPIGRGGFSLVWLEKCTKGNTAQAYRVLKEISMTDSRTRTADYVRELEAIAKFSQRKVPGLAKPLCTASKLANKYC
jgi:hypothetical protein